MDHPACRSIVQRETTAIPDIRTQAAELPHSFRGTDVLLGVEEDISHEPVAATDSCRRGHTSNSCYECVDKDLLRRFQAVRDRLTGLC